MSLEANMNFLSRLLLVLILAVVPAAHAGAAPVADKQVVVDRQVVVDGPLARKKLQAETRALLIAGKFDQLEKLAGSLRTGKALFPEGHWKLPFFYDGLAVPEQRSEQEWQRLLALLKNWQSAYPESVTARVAAASAWLAYGLEALGSSPSGADIGAWQLMNERRAQSLKLLNQEPAKPADDCPARLALLLTIGKSTGWERSRMSSLFYKAIELEPAYFYFYGNYMDYLSARWGGRQGEWLAFIEGADALAGHKGENELYTRMVTGMWQVEWSSFKDRRISWPRIRDGFREMDRKYPGSPYNLNNFAVFACLAGDLETARELLGRIGDSPYLERWRGGVSFDECRNRVLGAKPGRLTAQEIREKGLDMESLQLKAVAGASPRPAQP